MKTSFSHALKSGVATIVFGTALLAGPAFAQQAPAQQPPPPADTAGDTIIVTGSISRNPAAAAASPVTLVTSDDLLKRGVTSTAEALQQLTANNAGIAPGSWSSHGFATGASTVSLRGLNDAYTLILFDGMRMAPYPLADDGTRTIVDVNSVPSSVVHNIEVLQDSASATYGSDAIAGVINVLAKKQVVGLPVNMSAGISQRGDAGERRADVTYGFGKLDEQGFNIFANFEYQKNDALMQNARSFPFNTADLSSICGT